MAGCMALSGCITSSAIKRAMEYDALVHRVETGQGKYRIFERPGEDVIMTTPSLDRVVGDGVVKGATLGIRDVSPTEQTHRQAARDYLDRTGREDCRIVSGSLLMDPQYEFRFGCPGA